MLCVPFWVRRLLCPMTLFSSSEQVSPTPTRAPPKSWEDVYHDLGAGFPMDCSGVRYVDEDPEEQDGEAESQPETQTPKKKPKTAPAPSPSGTHALRPPQLPPQALLPLLAKV